MLSLARAVMSLKDFAINENANQMHRFSIKAYLQIYTKNHYKEGIRSRRSAIIFSN